MIHLRIGRAHTPLQDVELLCAMLEEGFAVEEEDYLTPSKEGIHDGTAQEYQYLWPQPIQLPRNNLQLFQ